DQFKGGRYMDSNSIPRKGLGLARMVGHITYLSDDAMGAKFGRELKNDGFSYDYDVDFQIESYLRYQGESFSGSFDPNTYLLMTRALDYFDPASEYGNSLSKAVSRAQAKFFLASFSTDWRFSPERSREIVDALTEAGKDVSYLEIDAPQGHDAFLMNIPRYIQGLAAYMNRVAEEG
ncbi:MAG: homoserine O-acetyltransferase, partial [Endozoicomonas sp.]